ncbi:response regulator transcription factor [Paenibacillus sp. strain BS8-2]
MLRVIIVDDERAVRVAMRTMIRWEENGFEVAGTASDGVQALKLIEESSTDIIITDLKMPNMNGIELLRELSQRGYAGKTLVLSNHGDYELVREAMKIGAVDYLLKVTLRPDDLLQALRNAGEQLSRDWEDKEHRLRIHHELIETQLEKRNAAWKELLQEDDAQLRYAVRDAERCSIVLDQLNGHLLYVTIVQYKQTLATGKLKNKKLLHFSVMNIIKEIVSSQTDIELIDLGEGHYAALLHGTRWIDDEPECMQLASNIVKLIRTYLNLDVNVTISGRFDGLAQLREQYRSCRHGAEATFYSSPGTVLFAAAVVFDDVLTGLRFPQWSADAKHSFEEENAEKLASLLDAMLIEMTAARCKPELVKNVFIILFTDLEHVVAKWMKLNGTSSEFMITHPSMTSLKQRMMNAGSAGQLKASVDEALHHAESLLKEVKRHSCRREVLQVIDILQKRLEDKITLDMLATSVNVTESYLCRIFKQDTGKSIFQYMNELKINRAIELLKQRDSRVKEVAVSVGIDDPFYFNRLFKKMIGLSPSEYRKKMLENHPLKIEGDDS